RLNRHGFSWASRPQQAIFGESNIGGPGGRKRAGVGIAVADINDSTGWSGACGVAAPPNSPSYPYRTFTYFRSTRGRGSPAKMLPDLSTVPNSGPLPVVVAGLPPWSRMKYLTQPFWASPIRIPCSKPGLSTLSDSESNT